MDRRVNSLKALLVIFIGASSLINVSSQQCNGGADCIPLKDCTGLYRQLQQGNTPQLTELLRKLHCGFVANNFDPKICCPLEYLSTRINADEESGGGTSGGSVPNRRPGGGSGQDRTQDPLSLLPNTSFCGIQNNDRIVGGTQADLDEHPWMALLRYDKPRGHGFYCGGVLISSRYVLTAAHCVKGADLPPTWRLSGVRLGEWNTSSVVDCVGGDCNRAPLDIPIEEVIPHERYSANDPHQHNDIAMLRLSADVPFNSRNADFVKPICLPLSNALRVSDFNGYTFEVAGWGKTESRSESDVKMKVRVPVMSKNECARIYQRAERVITNSQLCAGGLSGMDSCRGDSGGALMGYTPSAENWLVAGIVSYGPSPCGTPGWPGVYTRVGAYIDWILFHLRP